MLKKESAAWKIVIIEGIKTLVFFGLIYALAVLVMSL